MGQWAELGPLDPQISRSNIDRRYFSSPESALESFHALRFAQKEVTEYLDIFVDFLTKRGIAPRHAVQEAKELIEATIGHIYTNVTPFELGSSGRALEVMERYCSKILGKSYDEEKIKAITQKLVWEYPDHEFFIDAEEARQIGLNVKIANQKEQALLDEFSKMLARTNDNLCLGTLIPEEEGKESNSEEEGKESNSEEEGKESNSEDQGKESDSGDQGKEEE